MSWDSILEKKLLNMVLVGTVNSARDPQEKNASTGKRANRASQTEA